ncbi:hypothetical protein SCAR479_06796 [Seiridium cardinale]|uniref:Uncharacterized protein n=1 Tax=Seiridium cardinale TaxID=138064 RepID=A0ABR2XRR5_9PEZI
MQLITGTVIFLSGIGLAASEPVLAPKAAVTAAALVHAHLGSLSDDAVRRDIVSDIEQAFISKAESKISSIEGALSTETGEIASSLKDTYSSALDDLSSGISSLNSFAATATGVEGSAASSLVSEARAFYSSAIPATSTPTGTATSTETSVRTTSTTSTTSPTTSPTTTPNAAAGVAAPPSGMIWLGSAIVGGVSFLHFLF